jgi:hypothetical protein
LSRRWWQPIDLSRFSGSFAKGFGYIGVATLPMAATVLIASGGLVRFQIQTVAAAFAYNDPIRSFDVTGSAKRNGPRARDLPGKRAIQEDAAERGGKGGGTTASFSRHNSEDLQTNSRSGHAISKISHLTGSPAKNLKDKTP